MNMDERRRGVRQYKNRQHKELYRDKIGLRWRRKKLFAAALAFLIFLFYVLSQMRHWQDFGGDMYVIRTINQVMNRHSAGDGLTQPIRGSIVDRNFQTLAMSSITYNIIVDVRMLNGRSERSQEINQQIFREFFGMNPQEISDMLTRDTHYFVLEHGVPYSRKRAFDEWMEAMDYAAMNQEPPGRFFSRDIAFRGTSQRTYIHNQLASPILGFYHGLWWGLEGQYNELLSGLSGRDLTVFGSDGHITTLRTPPNHGNTLVTTLDLPIQRFAESLVIDWAGRASANNASVIVMNPHTGEVLAMAQYPSFNANDPSSLSELTTEQIEYLSYLDPTSQEFFDELFGIWANFNVSSTFEPGSTYKSFTAAKALDAGVITANQMFYCVGFRYAAGHRIRCAIYPRGHGHINLTQAIAVSCNVAHMDIAEALGRYAFWQYQRDFGFGSITGVDLPGEAAGLVHPISMLNASELATASFGQRFNVTPMQNITAFSALINGGNIIRPHLVSQILDTDGNVVFRQNAAVQRAVIAPEISDWMRIAMTDVVAASYGTGRLATIEGYTQGGKTATAEQGIQSDDNADFSWSISHIGYFPIDNPQFIIQVLLHEIPSAVYDAGFRSVVAMYREMMAEIIRIRNLPPCNNVATASTLHESEIVESLIGLDLQEAINRLNTTGRPYEISGSGSFVQTQFPPAGVRSAITTPLVLHLDDDGRTALVPVPNVIGQPLDFAREILIASGFVPRNNFSVHEGENIVYAQSGSNLSLPAGTDILLNIR